MRGRLALLVAVLLTACSTTHTIVSPECPPDDSLATQRHALGCGVYAPKDTTP